MSTPPPNEFPRAGRIVGVIYLVFCAALGGGLPFLAWEWNSLPLRYSVSLAAVAGADLTMIVRVKDPTLQPIRWGLLWLATGFLTGHVLLCTGSDLVTEIALAVLVGLAPALLLWNLARSSPPKAPEENPRSE